MIRRVSKNLLLTHTELACLQLAVRHQRRHLLRQVLTPIAPVSWLLSSKFRWSHQPLRASAQYLILLVLLPMLIVWQLTAFVVRLLLLPVRLAMTLYVPKGLVAPGEKNLAGMHNAFASHFQFPTTTYIDCFDGWILILYGEKAQACYSLRNDVEVERRRLLACASLVDSKGDDYFRPFVAHARERLSRKLGHYLAAANSSGAEAAEIKPAIARTGLSADKV